MYGKHALAMFDRGWRALVPIRAGDRVPHIKGWNNYNKQAPSRETVARYASQFPDASIGLAAGHGVVMIDLDVDNKRQAKKATGLADEHLGSTPLIRIGRSPRSVRIYAVEPDTVPTRRGYQVEVFGSTGVVTLVGLHAKTGNPYQWPLATPWEVAPSDLSVVKAAQIDAFMVDMAKTVKAPEAVSGRISASNGALPSGFYGLIAREGLIGLDVARALIAGATEGRRHLTARDAVFVLVALGWPDEAVATLKQNYLELFDHWDQHAEGRTFDAMLEATRRKLGPDLRSMQAATGVTALIPPRWQPNT